jgi:nitroimidazol reductase NimA-like FMN-containing flavoprotein (pyridoxamine 5'-phosphate oxidase superfamily)
VVKVLFSEHFVKQLQKTTPKAEAKKIILWLQKTVPKDGDYITQIGNIILKEKKSNSTRFYFVFKEGTIRFLAENEYKEQLLKFVDMSKKNNQQQVIDKLKEDITKFGIK